MVAMSEKIIVSDAYVYRNQFVYYYTTIIQVL